MAAQVVYAAAELRIADLLADGPQSSEDLAVRAEAHLSSVRRLLLALAALGVVDQVDDDLFGLTDMGHSLREDAEDSVRSLVLMLCGPPIWRSWAEYVWSLHTGEPGWHRANGSTIFEYYQAHPGDAAIFNAAMAEHTRDAAPALVQVADFGRFGTVVDVGGGQGTLIAEILRAHPGVRGVLFDAPAALTTANATLEVAAVAARCRVVSGDFFTAVPARGDAYVLKQVLHDWDDERAMRILSSVRSAMSPTARLLVFERMLPEPVIRGDAYPLLLDALMLAVTGGRQRTRQEFECLFESAGLAVVSVSDALPPFHYRVIETVPASDTA